MNKTSVKKSKPSPLSLPSQALGPNIGMFMIMYIDNFDTKVALLIAQS